MVPRSSSSLSSSLSSVPFPKFSLTLVSFVVCSALFLPKVLGAIAAGEDFQASAQSAAENSPRVDHELLALMEEGYQILDVVDHEFPATSGDSLRLTWGTISYILVAKPKQSLVAKPKQSLVAKPKESPVDQSRESHDQERSAVYQIVEITIEYVVGQGYRISQIKSLKIP